MGNEQSGNVNAGIVGVDWSKNGGGVTLFGLRMGGGPDGFEAGPNVGLGVQVNGKGLHAGAGAKVAIGNGGLKTSSGAKATAGDKKAGAAADAKVGWDGETECNAYTSTNDEFETAQADLAEAKNDFNHHEETLRNCKYSLTSAESKLTSSYEILNQRKREYDVLVTRVKETGIKKTSAAHKYDASLLASMIDSGQNSQTNQQLTVETNKNERDRLHNLLMHSERKKMRPPMML